MRPLPAEDLAEVVAATAPLWGDFRGGRILVTGATGFFGRWLLESLLAADRALGIGAEIHAQSRDPAKFLTENPHLGPDSGIRWLAADPRRMTPEDVARAGVTKLDAIVHLVTEADNAATVAAPAAAIETIAGSTRRALQLAAATGARRVLFTSSGSVYRRGPQRLSEHHPVVEPPVDRTSALALGGAAKLAAERACEEYARATGTVVTIARCFAFAGPGLATGGKFALGNFLADAVAGREVVVTGDGTPVRSYLHGVDLATWLWTILFRGVAARPYNVGAEAETSLGELAYAVARAAGRDGAVRILTPRDAGRTPDRYVPDTRRARTELGLRETIPLDDGLRRTLSWMRGEQR